MQQKPKRGQLVILLILLTLLAVGWTKHNAIYDWLRLRNYSASSQVMQLATDTTMTAKSSHLFYVNHPALQSSSDFNASCPNNGGEKTIILGCYRGHETGIYLFTVSDPELEGVMQVTAAHEALHAVYDRLSTKERGYVNGLLEDYYHNDLHDQRILDTIEAYKKSEPNDVVNEMHSVFGTEVPNLPPALETYYRQFFSDRSKIVSYSQKYQAAFSRRKAQADSLLQQIKSLEQQLTTLKSQIDSQETALRAKRQALESQRSSVNNAQAFNAQVDDYNNLVAQYQGLINTYNQLVAQHNQLRDQYQAIAVEETQLFKELDSRSSTVTNQ